jgi:hypothetical protein
MLMVASRDVVNQHCRSRIAEIVWFCCVCKDPFLCLKSFRVEGQTSGWKQGQNQTKLQNLDLNLELPGKILSLALTSWQTQNCDFCKCMIVGQ